MAVTAVVCGGVLLRTWRDVRQSESDSRESVREAAEEAERISPEEKHAESEQAELEQVELEHAESEHAESEQVKQEEAGKEKGDREAAEQKSSDRISQEDRSEMENLIIRQDPSLYTYEDMEKDIILLKNLYPEQMDYKSIAQTLDGRQVYLLVIGDPEAENKIFISGGIHAREYITCQLVMKQAAEFLERTAAGDGYEGHSYGELLAHTAIYVVPMINPDGVSISQLGKEGILKEEVLRRVEEIARLDGESLTDSYLTRWKANGNGVDLNRNFDALWEEYQDPAGHPSADHYKGEYPGCEPESAALIRLTQEEKFRRTISYHTQGSVIYWYFGQEGTLYSDTLAFGERIAGLTGYGMDADYTSLDPAGYKDWAIRSEGIPSLTIEVGNQTSPVPSEQFGEIWRRNAYVWEETLLEVM